MDEREALHTATRRYCMKRWSFWSDRYSERSIDPQHPEAEDIYPRYLVMDAILDEIESVVPHDFGTVEELRDLLVVAGQTAESLFTRSPGEIAARAMQAERDLFCQYARGLAAVEFLAIEPLFYRRALSAAEHTRLRTMLRQRWDVPVSGYWHPLLGMALPPNVVAFQQAWFDHALCPDTLHGILTEHGVARLWELRESSPDYELELAETVLSPMESESYLTSGMMDWLIYASHESSITVAGEWLIAAVKGAWPGWEQHLYDDWDYPLPPAKRR